MADLHCRLVPNAGKSEIPGWETGPGGRPILKIRLASPAVEGKANRALVSFLSEALGVPRSGISLIQGERSRTKRLRFDSLDADELRARLDRIVSGPR